MKKIIITASGLLFAASMFIGISSYCNINFANNLLLSNVEALTFGEYQGQMCFKSGGQDCFGDYVIVCPDGFACYMAQCSFYSYGDVSTCL